MSEEWFTLDISSGAELDRAGVFAWLIDGEVVYVGRATALQGSWKTYERNLDRLQNAGAYRPDDPDGFRAVHHALDAARQDHRVIQFRVLETCSPEADLTAMKRRWVAELCPRLNGQPRPRRTM